MPAPPGAAAVSAIARRSASVAAETRTRSPATARTAASCAGRASTRTCWMPSSASWPSSRSSRSRPPSAAAPRRTPSRPARSPMTIAVVTAVGSPTGAPAAGARRSDSRRRVTHAAGQGRRRLATGRLQIPQHRVPARDDRRRARSAARWRAQPRPCARRRAGSSISSSSAAVRAPTSSGGTSRPSSPWPTMSDGPRGQSKLTTGRPLPIASTSTSPKPSQREESANSEPAASAAPSRPVRPGQLDRQAGRARARARRARARSRRSAASSPGGARRPARHASISRSKPFWTFSRPAATTTGASGSETPPSSSSTGFGIRAHAVAEQRARSRARRPAAEHGQRVEPAVVAADVGRQPRAVRAEVQVLLPDHGHRRVREPGGEQVQRRAGGDQRAAAQRAQAAQRAARRSTGCTTGRRSPRGGSAGSAAGRAAARRPAGARRSSSARTRTPSGQREERPLAAAQHAHDLDLVRLRERAGERERRADRAAEAPGVGEQEADGPGVRRAAAAAARDQGERAEDGAVQRDRGRAEQAAPAGLARLRASLRPAAAGSPTWRRSAAAARGSLRAAARAPGSARS